MSVLNNCKRKRAENEKVKLGVEKSGDVMRSLTSMTKISENLISNTYAVYIVSHSAY